MPLPSWIVNDDAFEWLVVELWEAVSTQIKKKQVLLNALHMQI